MESYPWPLSESLGLPDVFPHLPGCPEDELSADALQHGYQHSEAQALGFDAKRELQLTLTDQPPGFYSPASIAYWRKALRQQLQGPSRHLAAKRKADVLFDTPLGAGSVAAAGEAAPAAPRFPQQPSRGAATREVAEAWARQQLASPGAPPLRLLGWGAGGEAGQVPHGFPRTSRMFELLAELAPPMPRALWFLRVICLNRTRPGGWEGASEAQQRSRQLTEELLSFLDTAAPAPHAAAPTPPAPAGRPPRPGLARQQPQGLDEGGEAAGDALPQQWRFGLRLAGHCCAAGLLDAAKVAEWAAGSRLLLALPPAARRQVFALLELSLPAAQLAQQQVLSLLEACLRGAEAAGAAAARRGPASRDADEVQQGLLQAAAQLVRLHPAAFVAADEQLLQPLAALRVGSGSAQPCVEWIAAARQRLSQALHARVLHCHDAKAAQLLDRQLRGGSSAAAAAAALLKLLSGQPAAAAAPPALGEAVRLVCDWAVAAPAADFGAALAEAAGAAPAEGGAWRGRGVAALHPERVLYALAVLQALQAQQEQEHEQQQEQQAEEQAREQQAKRQKQERAQPGPAPSVQTQAGSAQEALQAGMSAWLFSCAADPQLPAQPWRQQRLLHLALLAAEAGLLCPVALLRTCLAAGAFQPAAARSQAAPAVPLQGGSTSSSAASSGGPATFHLAVLEQLHPLLDYPSLAGGSTGSGGGKAGAAAGASQPAWPFARQRFAWAREAVLAQYSPGPAASAAAAASLAADEAQAAEWEELLRVPTPASSSSQASSGCSESDSEAEQEASRQARRGQRWHDPALQALSQDMLQLLGLRRAGASGEAADSSSAGAAAAGPSRSVSPVADGPPGTPAAFGELLARVCQLQPWQQRHTAGILLAAAKAFLASTDSSNGRRSPSPAAAAAAAALGPASSAGLTPHPCWLLQSLALLRECGGHREALSLISTCLNVLQRAVAAAVRAATAGQQSQQPRPELGAALSQAQQRWQQSSRVPPALLFALLSAHAGSLAASDIASKLLPMLAGGLWRLQQPQHQKAAQQSLAPQLELAAELLALPGSACGQWLEKMEQQHGGSHWVVAHLQQRAAALRAQRGGSGGTQQLVQQAASACLQAFVRRAQQLPAARGSVLQGPGGGSGVGTGVPVNGEQPDVAALLLQALPRLPAGTADGADVDAGGTADADAHAHAAALAAAQRSLTPAALPAVLQCLSHHAQRPELGLQAQLLALCPAASQALLLDARQAHSALHHHAHLPGAAGSAPAASWQLAMALFASSAGHTSSDGGSGGALLRLNASEAMAAAVAAATPTTAPCCWLLLRLLLDEQQRQGGHRLAEAERQLAARVAHEAVRRPRAAAALADTLCSLSPSAAAGQQLLVEVESMLRHPLVDLERQAAAPPAGVKPHLAAAPAPLAPPPPPFAGEQGLVEAALVCLSTGSSGERQHAFAQQLIKQLAALADVGLGEPGSTAAHAAGGYASGIHSGTAASPAVVQVSAWLRLALLLPLLPLVYKHRSADAGGGLRGQLLRALLRLLASPAVCADAAAAAADCAGTVSGRAAATAAAAAAAAGEPLPQRLLHLLRALLVGGWASWMRLEGGKLRDVPAYEHSRQLAAEASALPLPPRLQAAIAATLPLAQQQGLAVAATCRAVGANAAAAGAAVCTLGGEQEQHSSAGSTAGASAAGHLSLDPWLLLEGGTAGGSGAAAVSTGDGLSLATGAAANGAAPPPWLEGAVKRRRRDLAYMPTPGPVCEAALTIEEQLRRRGGGREEGAAAGAGGAASLLERGGSVDLAAGLFAW